jgi:uncharacterized damage-inducible protein DinB
MSIWKAEPSANLIARFQENWPYDRKLTYDLLDSLDDQELSFSPYHDLGPFWKQFRHLGRVQENYLNAISAKQIEFSTDIAGYTGEASSKSLKQYLKLLDTSLAEKLKQTDPAVMISWFDEKIDLYEHLRRILCHEVLHHGQWIVYIKMSGKTFPSSWSTWGL